MSDTQTFEVVKPFNCFATDGNVKPTNSYYGNSQILRPVYNPLAVPVGTRIHTMPGGMWLEINGKLLGFSLDSRNPNDVGAFEKHHDPTHYVWKSMMTNCAVLPRGEVDMDAFMPKYRAYGNVA